MGNMAPILIPRKLDGTEPNTDTLGFVYIGIAIIYTILLAGELFLLYRRHSAFCVRVRSLPVVFAAVSILHVYLIIVLLVYPWNGLFPCAAEFWIMSIFLPSGFAFFQCRIPQLVSNYSSLTCNSLQR